MSKRSVTPSRGTRLSLAQQAFALQGVFPEAVLSLKPTKLVWTGLLAPTPLSREYTVRISYLAGRFPRVVVVDPPLVPDEDGRLPHLYREGSLCLHEVHEWNGSMLIVDSIIPWTSEWLAHYELWKSSGEWHGDSKGAESVAVLTPKDHRSG